MRAFVLRSRNYLFLIAESIFSEIKGYLLYFGIARAFCVNIFMQSNLASLNNIKLPISHEVYFLGSHRNSGKDFSTVNCNDFNPWIHGGYIWFI